MFFESWAAQAALSETVSPPKKTQQMLARVPPSKRNFLDCDFYTIFIVRLKVPFLIFRLMLTGNY